MASPYRSSNWREPISFVGNDYAFRDYFRKAMEEGTAEHFALGSVSKRPGLYISRRVGSAAAPLGVVVVKLEFDRLESDWRDTHRPVYVTDDRGVVLITSIPSWRFMMNRPAAGGRPLRPSRSSLQFGDAPLAPLPIVRPQPIDAEASLVSRSSSRQRRRTSICACATPVPTTPWHLEYLVPTDAPVAASVREMRLLTLAVLRAHSRDRGAFCCDDARAAAMKIAAEQADARGA